MKQTNQLPNHFIISIVFLLLKITGYLDISWVVVVLPILLIEIYGMLRLTYYLIIFTILNEKINNSTKKEKTKE